MRNVLRVFSRDILRLFKNPTALVVVIFLMVLPALYAWVNVIGFWDPYGNTGNLRVCIVNEDTGATTDATGRVNLGDRIVDELSSNTQLGWAFVDYDTAMDEVESGEAYAAFVIPSDFSYDFTTLLTGDPQQPQIDYYVNEKSGAVSPKLTDAGATALDETINSEFVSTASGIIVQALDEDLSESQGRIDASRNDVTGQLNQAQSSIALARSSISSMSTANDAAIARTADAQTQLQQAKSDISGLSDELALISTMTSESRSELDTYSSTLLTSMGQGSILASQAAARTNAAAGKVSGLIDGASSSVDSAIASGEAAADENDAVISQLTTVMNSMPDGPQKTQLASIISDLQTRNATLRSSLSDLEQTSSDIEQSATTMANHTDTLTARTQDALTSADAYRTTLSDTTLPAIDSSLSQISATSGALSGTVANQMLLVDQASIVVDQLSSTLRTTSTALAQTDTLLASMQGDLDTVNTDITALDTSNAIGQFFGGSIDANKVADFMLSPTEITTESLYALNSYGSAMAPLFTNLALWIGVFMLMVILKLEVDDEGIENLTIAQRYWARWLFLVPIAALQAIICCTGNLVIGVQTVNVPLYYLTAVIASLTYLSIQYALSVTLQHVGKGICMILVFAQIPAATGLYPVEMTPSFFQHVYPALPFTYGINAMRETIGGFYGNQWGQLIGMLILFMAVAFFVGLLIRPYLTNLNRLFARQITETDILNGEKAQVPVRRFRLGQIIQALSDREEYRLRLERSEARFLRWYPRLKIGAAIFGIAVPTIITVIFALAGGEKVILLTLWLVWLIAVMMFLIIVEHARDSIQRQGSLGNLSDEELRSLFSERNSLNDDNPDGVSEYATTDDGADDGGDR